MVGEQFAEKAFSREIGLKNIIEINGKKYKIVKISSLLPLRGVMEKQP